MLYTVVRVARAYHHCDSCGDTIAPGERYLVHRLSPGSEFGHPLHWLALYECEACAIRCGRAGSLQGRPGAATAAHA